MSGLSTTQKSKTFAKRLDNLHHIRIRSLFIELFLIPYSEAFITLTTVKIYVLSALQ